MEAVTQPIKRAPATDNLYKQREMVHLGSRRQAALRGDRCAGIMLLAAQVLHVALKAPPIPQGQLYLTY